MQQSVEIVQESTTDIHVTGKFRSIYRQAFRRLHGLPIQDEVEPLDAQIAGQLFALARRHGVHNLLQAELATTDEQATAMAYAYVRHAARFTQEAERLYALLAPHARSLALLKGPALARQAWPEPGLRSFDDLDFLCHPEDVPQLSDILTAEGYMPEVEEHRRRSHLWHFGWGISFHHPDGFIVELKHRLFPPHYPWPARNNSSWRDQFTWQKLDEVEARAPTPALHLLYGCLHGIWHGWERLAWLLDIAGLLVRHPDALPKAQELAGHSHMAIFALAGSCKMVNDFLGVDFECLPELFVSPQLLAQSEHLLFSRESPVRGQDLRRYHELWMNPHEKQRYRIRRILTPGDGDFRWWALPPAMHGAYWLLRPVRFVWQQIVGS